MRLAAQIKGGFYPAPPEAVEHAVSFLKPPSGGCFCILDPCCGMGAALGQLEESLRVALCRTYGIELDENRALHAQSLLSDAHILGPASFFGVRCTKRVFGLIWCNPPFDDEMGGGDRVELQFLRRAIELLVPGGVICFVVPEMRVETWQLRQSFLQWFEDVSVVPFPENCRQYGEVILFGRKREQICNAWRLDWNRELQSPHVYEIPDGRKPTHFEKVELTDVELWEALRTSPLWRHLNPNQESNLVQPPMSLGKGHIALLLASGHLDGIVRPDGEAPHVVRGTARKVQYVSSVEESENGDGSVTTKTSLSEKIVLTVRAVGCDGQIHTFEGG